MKFLTSVVRGARGPDRVRAFKSKAGEAVNEMDGIEAESRVCGEGRTVPWLEAWTTLIFLIVFCFL